MREKSPIAVSKEILRASLIPQEDALFATGEPANNTIDIGRLFEASPTLPGEFMPLFVEKVAPLKPDLFIVSEENTKEIMDICATVLAPVVSAYWNKEKKEYFLNQAGKICAASANNIIIAQGVINNLTHAQKIFEIPDIENKVDAVVGLIDRNPNRPKTFPVPVISLVTWEVPAVVHPGTELGRMMGIRPPKDNN